MSGLSPTRRVVVLFAALLAVALGVGMLYGQGYAQLGGGYGYNQVVCHSPSVSKNITVGEGAGTAAFKISSEDSDPQCRFKVKFQTVDGTATSGQDYVGGSGSTSLHGGQTATVDVTIIDDAIDENDETFGLKLGGDGHGTGIATIVDNDLPPTVTVGQGSVAPDGSTVVFPITLSGPSGLPITVGVTIVDGVGNTVPGGTITFNPGETQKSVTVPTAGRDGGSVGLMLSSPSNATITGGTSQTTIPGSFAGPGGTGGPNNGNNAPNQSNPPGGDLVPPVITLSAPVQRNGAVFWQVTCPATETVCNGTVTVTTSQAGKAKVAVIAKKKKKKRVVKLGSARYRLKGGETKQVKVKLNGKARRLVRKKHHLPVTATFVTKDSAGNKSRKTQNFTLNEQAFRHS